jgi:hypothetical protein
MRHMLISKYTNHEALRNYNSPAWWQIDEIGKRARELLDIADAVGITLTIEQRPRQPLAMGNYEHVVTVRPARIKDNKQ